MTSTPDSETAPRRAGGALGPRLATAAAGIPILLVLIAVGGPPYTVAVAALLAIGASEVAQAAGLSRTDPLALWSAASAGALAVAMHGPTDARLGVLTALVIGALVLALARAEVGPEGFRGWAAVVAGATYAGVLGCHLVLLRRLDDGRDWVLFMLFTTFATDTAAYAVGRAFGRRKLAPRISPGKTVAGSAGGLAGGTLVAVALGALLNLEASPAALAALGLAAAVAAQVGDLAESLLKRSLGVKDMGMLFPGHGGVLDRLDSVLFVAPVVYYAVRWIIR